MTVVQLPLRPTGDPQLAFLSEVINSALSRRGYSEKFRSYVVERATEAAAAERLKKWRDPVPLLIPSGLSPGQVEAIRCMCTSLLQNVQADYVSVMIGLAEKVASLEWQVREIGLEVRPLGDL